MRLVDADKILKDLDLYVSCKSMFLHPGAKGQVEGLKLAIETIEKAETIYTREETKAYV